MMLMLITGLILAEADTSALSTTEKVVLTNGDVLYGVLLERSDRFDFTPDTPWKPVNRRIYQKNEVELHIRETPEAQAERRKREAAKDGFALAGGQWVPLQEIQLAERATAMAAEVRAASAPAPANAASSPQSVAGGPVVGPPQPGFLAQWGFHAAIIVVAGSLIALVVRFAILA